MKHVINKLTVELACSDEQQAFSLREGFYNEYYNEFVDVMENSCNHFFDQEKLILLEKLEINLGAFDYRFAEKQQYVAVFKEAFEKALKACTRTPSVKKTITQSHLDSLQFFLTQGVLPWWINESDVDLERWCIELQLSGNGNSFISWLLKHQNEEQIWKRIVYQLAPSFKAFIITLIPELEVAEASLKNKLAFLIQQKSPSSSLQNISIYEINDFVLADAHSILRAGSGSSYLEDISFQKFLKEQLSKKEMDDLPEEIWKGKIDLVERNENHGNDVQPSNQPEVILAERSAYSEDVNAEKNRTEKAGIILLAAFLPVLFNRLGIWHEGKWADSNAVNTAVILLHYLATGNDAPFEYELSLEKIICGLPLSMPVNSRLSLQASEKKEAGVLLESIIEHWSVLRDTSVLGLRQAFLQREGLLYQKKGNWFLEVEKKTMDVLMEQIPWGYATVILPWNKYMICTEW